MIHDWYVQKSVSGGKVVDPVKSVVGCDPVPVKHFQVEIRFEQAAVQMSYEVLVGDVREQLATLRDDHFHCCVTSPPYYALRDYGVNGQIGMEETPSAFVESLVDVFRDVGRVLRDDGTLWLNMGDSYNATGRREHFLRSGVQCQMNSDLKS